VRSERTSAAAVSSQLDSRPKITAIGFPLGMCPAMDKPHDP
jgi:hypothetical protein